MILFRNVELFGVEGQVVVKGDLLLDNIDFLINEICDKGEDYFIIIVESIGKYFYVDIEFLFLLNMNMFLVMFLNDNYLNLSFYNNKIENIVLKLDLLINFGYLVGK